MLNKRITSKRLLLATNHVYNWAHGVYKMLNDERKRREASKC